MAKGQSYAQEDVMPEAADVSIVMVSYNTGPILWRSIESVLIQPTVRQLILVDNGNPADEQTKLRDLADKDQRVCYVNGQGNIGFASGCNLGVQYAEAEYILLLNPDCIIEPETIQKTVAALQAHPDAYLAGAHIVNPDNTEQNGTRRHILTPWMALVESLHLYKLPFFSRLCPRFNIRTSATNEPAYVPAISGAFMLIQRSRYLELGGLDEQYFFHVEDLDFCLAVQNKGGRILYVPSAKVVHYRSTSNVSDFYVEWNKTKGFVRYFSKHFRKRYFPGAVIGVIAAIYIRLALRLVTVSVEKMAKRFFSLKPVHIPVDDSKKRAALLESYVDVQKADQPTIEKDPTPVLLAGATGQVGLCILRRLLAAEIPVTALYFSRAVPFHYPLLQWKQADLVNDVEKLQSLPIQTFISTAPIWHLPDVLRSLSGSGIKRLIAFGSTSLFAKANSMNPHEKDIVQKFAWAEKEIAAICEEQGINWTILRPTLIYGVGLDRNVMDVVHFMLKYGVFPVTGGGTGLRQPVHADDLAKAVLQILDCENAYGKAYNLCGGERLTYYQMVERIANGLDKKVRILDVPALHILLDLYAFLTKNHDLNGEVARRMVNDQVFDVAPAQHDFHYQPRDFLDMSLAGISWK